jgi:beta-galactosidase
VHYFRIPSQEWDDALRRIAHDGFNLVDIYIPWSIHEPEASKFDFAHSECFLGLAQKHDLFVVARPGPYVCSEFDQGGFPRWLSGKDTGFRSNNPVSRQQTKHWYDAVMPILARHQVTGGGPVIMVQIENEYGHPQ